MMGGKGRERREQKGATFEGRVTGSYSTGDWRRLEDYIPWSHDISETLQDRGLYSLSNNSMFLSYFIDEDTRKT